MEFLIKKDTAVSPHHKHWQFSVGSGHALLALRTDYTRQLKFIHDTLGIERVRFHGIFNDDMRTYTRLKDLMPLPNTEGIVEYNFNACGVAYDNVLEAGMKPFVELSFMPKGLAVDDGRPREGSFFYKPLIVPPEDEAEYVRYIQEFIRFLLHRYGEEEVEQWYFEVWNEPDLPGAFWNGTRDEYFRFYEMTARAIKEIDPKIPVGGPATSGSKWVASFTKFCRENDVPVDFISTHQYAGDPLGGVTDQGDPLSDQENDREDFMEGMKARMMAAAERLKTLEDRSILGGFRTIMPDKSELEDIPNDLFIRNSAIVKEQAGGLPVFYTEWNENAGFTSWTNDTRKVAAYDVKTALDVADSVTGSSIWCFSDIFEELHPFPQEFHGGFGMITQNGIPKPVYYGMRMLYEAGDERLDLGEEATKGEIGIAAFRKKEALQVLLLRQKMKNLDLPKEEAVVTVELEKAPKTVTLQRIDEEHGNPLKCWKEMGPPASLNKKEAEEIRKKSEVVSEDWPFTYEDGKLTLKAELGVNDLYFFEIAE